MTRPTASIPSSSNRFVSACSSGTTSVWAVTNTTRRTPALSPMIRNGPAGMPSSCRARAEGVQQLGHNEQLQDLSEQPEPDGDRILAMLEATDDVGRGGTDNEERDHQQVHADD
jgi:hypothetical protein